MSYREYNSGFFGWEGFIPRRDYAINMFIVSALYAALSFMNFQVFETLVPFKFIYTVLIFSAEILKFMLVMCALSLVYRRINDFAASKPQKFRETVKKLFAAVFVFPALYIFTRGLLNFIPILIIAADAAVFYALLPAAVLCSIVLCFIKQR